jgi:acetoin:2,6-dichlorophenolindophenol oxidoreductase subunit beta
MSMPSDRILTYSAALLEATEQEMAANPKVVVFGMGVDDFKGTYGTTMGLHRKFGAGRCFDTPLSEDGMTGVAIGMALAGWRPIHVHIRMDFLLLALNQIINIAAKARYMYGGQVATPIVVRSIIGRGWGQGSQHSQALYPLLMHVPGLRVVAPTTPYDAKGLLLQSLRQDDPVMFVEHRLLHGQKGPVPEAPYTVPFGKARVLAEGRDITLVGISYTNVECLRARALLKEEGISAEVVDCVSLKPLDTKTILDSAARTGRLLVVENGWTFCGASAEILAQAAERFQSDKRIRMGRMGFAPVNCPTTRNLENAFYPDASKIAAAAHEFVRGTPRQWAAAEAAEVLNFKGPF